MPKQAAFRFRARRNEAIADGNAPDMGRQLIDAQRTGRIVELMNWTSA